ncbi:caspase family protein [Nocardia sp. NPDC052566]|uniref:VMAP-C domain-containing protein n=1 Tax=Nocardia sp. NPDC052566 TaxID=3364330 RepID=UPI0037CA541B
MNIFPARTLAVIIGIEDYRIGPGWPLNGPALDACRFASWLIERGVDAGSISLLVSALPSNAAAVDALPHGITVGAADHQTIRRALTSYLYRSSSDLLILYIGGHGYIDKDVRRILYADATADDEANLNLTSLLKSMRTERYSGHLRQLVFVDSCLSFAHETHWDTSAIPDETFASGRELHDYDQRAFFAASPGQRAANDDRLRTGLFSRVLRELLDPMVAEGISRLDHGALLTALRERFEYLRGTGHTEQSPSYLAHSANGTEEVVVDRAAFRRAAARESAQRHLDFDEYQALKAILHQAAIHIEIGETFRRATRNTVDLPTPRNVDDLFSVLEALRGPVEPTPLFSFLVTFAESADTGTQERLWEWLHTTAPRYRIDVDELRSLRAHLRRRVYLVRLLPDYLDDGYQVTIWEYAGTEGRQLAVSETPWRAQQLADQLSGYLRDFDPQRVDDVAPVVEFLMPITMFDERVEDLEVTVGGGTEPLGVVFPVVVRPIERIGATDWHSRWRSGWADLEARGDSYDAEAITVVDEQSSFDIAVLSGRVCTVLAYRRNRSGADPIVLDALAAGIPIMLWQRTIPGRPPRRSALDSVLRGRPLRDLRDTVRGQRAAARTTSSGDHIGRDLVLLWDDPHRIPAHLRLAPPGR